MLQRGPLERQQRAKIMFIKLQVNEAPKNAGHQRVLWDEHKTYASESLLFMNLKSPTYR